MVVELISVGTELLLGNIVNTNACFLSQQFAAIGMSVYYQTTVGDNEKRLQGTLKEALKRSDIVILTGGLGPTKDDLTKEVTAKVLKKELVEDKNTKKRIKEYLGKSHYGEITENNWKQAMIPEGALVIDNDNGTAPGLIVGSEDGKKVILLPGPPNELIPMFKEKILPILKESSEEIIYSEMVKVAGIGESRVETEIGDLIQNQSNPTIAPYAKTGEVHLRITAKAKSEKEAKKLVKPIVEELKKRFKNAIYTNKEEENLEDALVRLLNKHDLKVTTAESCTGGLIAGRLVNVAGVSEVFNQGLVTYSNKAKRKLLDVSKSTLKKYGAVSKQTAKEMAVGAAIFTNSDVAVAVTGIAGPDGGTEEKPVGLVYIGCYVNEKTVVKEFRFNGNRNKVREVTVVHALDLLRRTIIENYE